MFAKNQEKKQGNPLQDEQLDEGPLSNEHRTEEHLNISEILAECEAEVKSIKSEVLTYKHQNFFKQILRSSISSLGVSGDGLYKIHPTKVAKKVLSRLHSRPADMRTRLELITLVRKSGRKLSYENYRTLFIQANVACSLGSLSVPALQIVISAQERFYAKLGEKCQDEFSWIEGKMKEVGNDKNENIQSQLEQIRKHMQELQATMAVVKAFQKQTLRGLQGKRENPGTQIDKESILSIEDIQKYIVDEDPIDESQREEIKKDMMKKAREIAFLVRYIPLLYPVAHQMLEVITKLDPDKPLPYFFQARVSMTALNLSVSHYQGEQKPELAKKIQENFKGAFQFYSTAVNKIGPSTKSSTDFTILLEFSSLIHYYYKIATSLLGRKPPRDWLKNVFEKAQDALLTAHESGKADSLLKDIQRDMAAEGFIIT